MDLQAAPWLLALACLGALVGWWRACRTVGPAVDGRLVQAELDRQRHLSQAFSDNQPTLLAYIDREMHLQFANRAILEWFGLDRVKVIGQHLGKVLSSQAIVSWNDGYIARVLRGEKVERHMAMVSAEGVEAQFLTYRVPDTRDGQTWGFFFIATDVTAVLRTEAELAVANTALQAANESLEAAALFSREISDASSGAMTYWDGELRCRFANRTYLDCFDKTEQEVLGYTRQEIFGQALPGAVDDRLGRALGGEKQEFELRWPDLDGRRRDFQVQYIPALSASGSVQGVYMTAFDITPLKAAQDGLEAGNRELARARDAAEAATRAKSAFLANMSHEIRTPMNAILGLTHLLRQDGPAGPTAERLDRIGSAASHLLGLIDGILDLTKIESGHLELEDVAYSIDTVVDRAVGMVRDAARDKGLALLVDALHLDRPVRGDPTRLAQALVNLLGNAVKFTERGAVTLAVQVAARTDAAITLHFEVHDTGPGIAAADLARLFGAFEQADVSTTRRHGGAGLGLAMTRHIARTMGGDAGATSVRGAGSTFWITVTLPLDRALVERRSETGSAEERLRAAHAGARVLLAEDNPVNQEVARALVESAGLLVDVAHNGREAVALASRGDYALVLMDMQMPELDGPDATRQLRTRPSTRHLPIIAMTANAYVEDRAACLAAGMDDFLAKPVEPERLYEVLMQWLDRGGA